MNESVLIILAVSALIVVMAAIGMPLSEIIKASKLPAIVKLNPKNPWGIDFFDKNEWSKVALIKLMQAVVFCILFFLNFIWFAMKAAASGFVKTLEGTAKKAVKK